jgi:glycosyltransferase involved in cell wall biosynthesis
LNNETHEYLLNLNEQNIQYWDISEMELPYSLKKQALHFGIQKAKYNIIATIDADCYPESNLWLQELISPFSNNHIDCVLGVSPYISHTNFLSQFVRFDALNTMLQYLSQTLKGNAYMGIGRNMAFRKKLWNDDYLNRFGAFGFADDDTIVQSILDKTKIEIMTHEKVYSYATKSFLKFLKQKNRHIAGGKTYQPKQIYILGMMPIFSISFWFIIWIWMSYFSFHLIIFAFLALYILIKTYWIYRIEQGLNLKKKLFYHTLFLDFPQQLLLTIMPFFAFFKNSKRW